MPTIWLLSLTLFGQNSDWTEATLLSRFLDQNPIERETRARQAIAEAEIRGRTLWANPSLSVVREGAGRTEFYQASQALPLSGRIGILRAAGSGQSASIAAEGRDLLWRSRCLLRSSFYRLLAAQQKSKAWAEAGRQIEEVIAVLALREQAGEGSRFDRLRAERERAELSSLAGQAAAEMELLRGEVHAFLPAGESVGTVSASLDTPQPRLSLAEARQRALEHRADLEGERLRLNVLKIEQRAAARLKIPEPVLNAGFKRADAGLPRLETGPVVGLTLALPVFNQGQAEVAKFTAEEQRSRARLEQLIRRSTALVEASWESYLRHQKVRDTYPAEAAAELVSIARLAYAEGEIGILQLLDAYRAVRESHLRKIDLASAAKQAQIALELQMGEELQ